MDKIQYRKQIADVARDFYLSKLTIADISKKYNLSRYLITKYLDDAVSTGLVKITINAPIDRNLQLEAEFKKMFGIQNAYILMDGDAANDDDENIIEFSAQTIQDYIQSMRTIGVSWGGTVSNIINHFQTKVKEDLVFTQIMGDNLKYNSAVGSTPLVQKAAAKYEAHYLTVPAPLYIINNQIRTALEKEPAFIRAFTTMNKMDMIFAGIGTLASIDSIQVWRQHKDQIFPKVDLQKVVGMLYGRPFDINGNFLNPGDSDKLFGASIDTILAVPTRLAIVKSKFKSRALLGALRGNLITDVITNESVANRVLMEMRTDQ